MQNMCERVGEEIFKIMNQVNGDYLCDIKIIETWCTSECLGFSYNEQVLFLQSEEG